MTLLEIAQKKNCGGDSQLNTGKLGCLVELATPEHLIKMPKSTIIPKDTEFNLTYIKSKVQDGTFTPIIGASTFEDISSEDAYNTNSSGEKRLNLKGLIEHRYMFEEGHEFYKQMAKLESYKSDSYIIGDDEGNWLMAVNSNGDYVGFTSGHVTPEIRKSKVKGGDNEMKALVIQFLDRKQWDENYDIFLYENLGFTPEEIPTINGVNLSFTKSMFGGDTSIDLKAVLASDNNTLVEGITLSDILLIDSNSNQLTINALTESSPGKYNLELANTLVVNTEIKAELNGVIDVEDVLYRTNISEFSTVIPLPTLEVLFEEHPVAGSNVGPLLIRINDENSNPYTGIEIGDLILKQAGSVVSLFSVTETSIGLYEVLPISALQTVQDIQFEVNVDGYNTSTSQIVTPYMDVLALFETAPSIGDSNLLISFSEFTTASDKILGITIPDLSITLDGSNFAISNLSNDVNNNYDLSMVSNLVAGNYVVSFVNDIINVNGVNYTLRNNLTITI